MSQPNEPPLTFIELVQMMPPMPGSILAELLDDTTPTWAEFCRQFEGREHVDFKPVTLRSFDGR